jgi:hypothetical protein
MLSQKTKKIFQSIIYTFLVIVTVIVFIQPVWRLPHRVYIDYNEGWNAYFSEMAIRFQNIYQPLDVKILNNYPPLTFYLTGFVGKITNDTIIAGRILSIVGLILSSIMTSLLIHRITIRKLLSAFGGMALIGYMCIYHVDYVGMNDPQWIALGVMMSGFTLFIYYHEHQKYLFLSLCIMLIAGLMKHNLVSIPIAATFWLFIHDRKKFIIWIRNAILLMALVVLIFQLLYGKVWLQDIFLAPRVFHIGSIARVGQWLMPALIYIAVSLFVLLVDKTKEVQLFSFAAMIALIWGIIISAGAGIYNNVLFEFIIMVFILSFCVADKIIDKFRSHFHGIESLINLILFLPLLFRFPHELYELKRSLKEIPIKEKQISEDIKFLADYPNPVICENLALSYWAGKGFALDFYSTGQKLKSGQMKNEAMIQWLETQNISVIQINDERGYSSQLSEEINQYIIKTYGPIRVSSESGVFLHR